MNRIRALTTIIFSLLIPVFVNSCIILPYYVPPSGKGVIDTSDIKVGSTTKEEVFLKFGKAFLISDDEKTFTTGYTKESYSGWFVFFGFSGGASHTDLHGKKMTMEYYKVEIEFDDKDVVKRCENFKTDNKTYP